MGALREGKCGSGTVGHSVRTKSAKSRVLVNLIGSHASDES